MSQENPGVTLHPPFDYGHSYNQDMIPSAFPFLTGDVHIRPNKFKEEYKNQDENYHLQYAKWALFNSNEQKHADWLRRIKRNKRFYMGHQWEGSEDVEAFLKDETGQTRNRIKVTINQIRPMVEQFRGNAIRLAIGATAKSVSNDAKNRRERAMEEVMFTGDISQEFEALGNIIREYDSLIGQAPIETERNFNNVYVDSYVDKMNKLLRYSAELNEMEDMQIKVAESLVFSGLGLIEEFEHGGHLRKEAFDPEEFGWDRNARRMDLQDAAYQWRVSVVTLPTIFEKWQGLSLDERKALENYTSLNGGVANDHSPDSRRTNVGNSIPVYKVFWRDHLTKEYGWVEDEFGYPYHAELNTEDEFSGGTVYTEKDLIEPPNTPENRRLYGNGKKITRKKRKMVVDVLRYCIFIPGESVNYFVEDSGKKRAVDIALEYGLYDYQETNWMDLSNVKYPFKAWAWAYLDGEVVAPIDDIIDPQRFMNRIMSAIEGQINNAGGSGIFYDKDAVDDGPNEEARLQRAVNIGQPYGFRTRGKGVPNTVIPYDNTIKSGTYNMFGLFPQLKQMIQDTTGVNEGLRGESTGSDQLVGVTQLMIQRGSLMQEPFYNAVAKVFTQSHQATATIGKKIYLNNQREMAIITGDDGVEVFKLAEGMRNEDFRVFIKRDISADQIQQQADGALTVLLQSQLITKEFFVKHWGKSTLDQIQADLRIQTKRESIIALKQAQQQEAAMQEAAITEQAAAGQAEVQAQKAVNDQEQLEEGRINEERAHELNKMVLEAELDQQKQQG